MISRRGFLKLSLALGAASVIPARLGQKLMIVKASPQSPLDPATLPQFVDPLPIPEIIQAGAAQIELHMREVLSDMMPSTFTPLSGSPYGGTVTWAYISGPDAPTSVRPTYFGPIIVAKRGVPTEIRFVNNLGHTRDSQLLAYTQSTDQTLHWADPLNGEDNMCVHMLSETPMGYCGQNYDGPIPAAVHLHGAEVPPLIDGGPDAWFTSDGAYRGHAYYSKAGAAPNEVIYRYPNTQEEAPLWFHDHTLGATRLNVYAGLAGGYLIEDPNNFGPKNLPPLVPLVIQDRMFDEEGQLYFPAGDPDNPNPEHPFWTPEFIGDTIVVNGKVWPYLEVEQKRYRLLFYNGSNARTYSMEISGMVNGKMVRLPIWQIGTDGGYLDLPALINPNKNQRLVMMPGERADVIVDFGLLPAGATLVLTNNANAPYPSGDPVDPATTGRILQFRVIKRASRDTSYNPLLLGALRKPMVRLANPLTGRTAPFLKISKRRQLTLNEVMGMERDVDGRVYEGGPLEILVNNSGWDGLKADRTARPDFTPVTVNGKTDYYSEVMNEGETEVWEIVNLTADAHPIHTHLTQFQLLNRQVLDVQGYSAAYEAAFPGGMTDPMTGETYPAGVYIPHFGPPGDYNVPNADNALGGNPATSPYLVGGIQLPQPNERGWKDTIQVPPGMVTRFVVRFAPTSAPALARGATFPFDPSAGGHGYVWHCHIIDHEDNEMMRPDFVQGKPGAVRTYVQGVDY